MLLLVIGIAIVLSSQGFETLVYVCADYLCATIARDCAAMHAWQSDVDELVASYIDSTDHVDDWRE